MLLCDFRSWLLLFCGNVGLSTLIFFVLVFPPSLRLFRFVEVSISSGCSVFFFFFLLFECGDGGWVADSVGVITAAFFVIIVTFVITSVVGVSAAFLVVFVAVLLLLLLLYNCRMIFLYYHFSLVISYHSVWLGLELFGLVHVQVHTVIAGIQARAWRMWQSQMS